MSWKRILKRVAADFLRATDLVSLLGGDKQPWKILMYHRVIEPRESPYPLEPGMYVRPATFEMHLRYLKERCNLISLVELLELLDSKASVPDRTVVLTFDDGWKDNYTHAYPLLKKYTAPATIFLATDFINGDILFWTDELALLFSVIRHKGESVLSPGFMDDDDLMSVLRYVVTQDNEREGLYELINYFKSLPLDERPEKFAKLEHLIEGENISAKTAHNQFLSWDNVHEMLESCLVSIGCHSHNHHIFTELSAQEIVADLRTSYAVLKAQGIEPVSAFCYPSGMYDTETQDSLRSIPIRYALVVERRNNFAANPALLGRIGMHEDASASEALFACRLWGVKGF